MLPLDPISSVQCSVRRLVRAEVDLALATRFREIVTQLSDSSHVSPERMMQFLHRAEMQDIWIFGSFEEDLLVATLSLYFDMHPWGIEARVNNVVTDALYRGRGHCDRLLLHAWCVLPGIRPIGRMKCGLYKWTLCASNPIAIKAYKKFGFTEDKEVEMRMNITPELFGVA
jgi:ribosomal protein S18 acetylase RimI-like enzyme